VARHAPNGQHIGTAGERTMYMYDIYIQEGLLPPISLIHLADEDADFVENL